MDLVELTDSDKEQGITSLMKVVKSFNYDIVQMFITVNVDVLKTDNDGLTALNWACRMTPVNKDQLDKQIKIIEILVRIENLQKRELEKKRKEALANKSKCKCFLM